MVLIRQAGCNRAKKNCIPEKVVAFGQKWLYSGKVVVFGQKWLYSGEVVVFLQSGCIR